MKIKFGSLQLCKALENLGFTTQKQHGTSHQKWFIPRHHKIKAGLRPFIIVVQGKKQYYPPSIAGYLRELRNLGFSSEEIIKAFAK